MAISEDDYRRIRWQSRRGMLELDVLLLPFVERHFRSLDEADQELYREMLAFDDPVLLGWFHRGEKPADPALARLVARIRSLAHPGGERGR